MIISQINWRFYYVYNMKTKYIDLKRIFIRNINYRQKIEYMIMINILKANQIFIKIKSKSAFLVISKLKKIIGYNLIVKS